MSGYHDEVFYDDGHVVRTLTKLDDASTAHCKLGDIATGRRCTGEHPQVHPHPVPGWASWSRGTC
jgi:hypothetical protein